MSEAVGTDAAAPDPIAAVANAISDLQARMVSLERAPWADMIAALQAAGALVATGEIVFSTATSKPGCLPADGAAVSRTTYADLNAVAAAAGYAAPYGPGDGSTTFNVPDARGRALIASGTGAGLTARTLGQQVGVEGVTLSAAESGMPAHTTAGPSTANTGAGTAHAHTNSVPALIAVQAGATQNVNAGNLTATTGNESAHTHSLSAHTHTVSAVAATNAHTNMQPSLVLNAFVKT